MPKHIENWITFPDRVLCESFLSIGFEHVWAPRSHFPIGLFFALFASFSVYPWDRFGAILGGARAKVLKALHRSSVRPAMPGHARGTDTNRRNRQPLGAGKHAAELG